MLGGDLFSFVAGRYLPRIYQSGIGYADPTAVATRTARPFGVVDGVEDRPAVEALAPHRLAPVVERLLEFLDEWHCGTTVHLALSDSRMLNPGSNVRREADNGFRRPLMSPRGLATQSFATEATHSEKLGPR